MEMVKAFGPDLICIVVTNLHTLPDLFCRYVDGDVSSLELDSTFRGELLICRFLDGPFSLHVGGE